MRISFAPITATVEFDSLDEATRFQNAESSDSLADRVELTLRRECKWSVTTTFINTSQFAYNKVDLIRRYRTMMENETGVTPGLKESKDYIERLFGKYIDA